MLGPPGGPRLVPPPGTELKHGAIQAVAGDEVEDTRQQLGERRQDHASLRTAGGGDVAGARLFCDNLQSAPQGRASVTTRYDNGLTSQ